MMRCLGFRRHGYDLEVVRYPFRLPSTRKTQRFRRSAHRVFAEIDTMTDVKFFVAYSKSLPLSLGLPLSGTPTSIRVLLQLRRALSNSCSLNLSLMKAFTEDSLPHS